MKRQQLAIPLTLSLGILLSACSSESDKPEMAAAIDGDSSNQTSVPIVIDEVVDTSTLSVAEDFAFDTARNIDIEFDLEAARNTDASVSICTNYMQDGDAFDVDYDSCAVRGPMEDGVFSHSMEITNEFDSVIAVVWFQDSSMAPLHREFSVDDTPPMAAANTRGVRSVSEQRRVIVWK